MRSLAQVCPICQTPFASEAADLVFAQKFGMGAPTHCPRCRQLKRLAFRNERSLHRRVCGLCGKKIISIYRPDSPSTVFCLACFWSDSWDALSYGQSFNFNEPFFPQFDRLMRAVPQLALYGSHNENSDYVNYSGYNKNCYLIFAAEYNEDCLYGNQVIKSKNCIDTQNCFESEQCYEVTDADRCFELFFSKNCKNCSESMFLTDCRNCRNCLFCSNLRNKEFYVENVFVGREAFLKKRAEILKKMAEGRLREFMQAFQKLDEQAIHKDLDLINAENSSGDHLLNTKNVNSSFDVANAEDCKEVYTAFNVKDMMDVAHATDAELAYQGTSIGYRSYDVACGVLAWTSSRSRYFYNIHHSSDTFGCVGLKRKTHCILNKQYSQQEYRELMPRIIAHMKQTGEWGEFFPMFVSPFPYEETAAALYFPPLLGAKNQ